MKKITALSASLVLAVAFSADAAQFTFGDQVLTVPDGFEVELVAGTNVLQRPISMDYDELGRLYVTDSSGSSERGPKQLEDKSHRILRLEDTDGDGKFDKSVVFGDKVMFPEGCMWFDGSLYVSAPPSIWKFTDADGDGVAEKREEWHEGKTLTGCANDLHGPYLGPDGFIYWCKGAFAEQTYEVNGKPFTSKAAHIFRARPDHSRIEPVLTGGMDNPVGLAFSPTGERFLAGTFFEPHIPGRRDGVIHAIYGGVYGKPHPDVLDSHKKTGDLMPVMVHLGPAASASVISYKSEVLGKEYKDNLFVCNFNLHNVTRHVLTPDGATFKTEDSAFLSCEDPDFHPTCVLEDADGSLLVVDTGGWYKICCPTSQLYKPDVLGAIYRIRRKGAPKVEDARGLKIQWAKLTVSDLVQYLGDQRPYVVEHATQLLAKKGKEAVPTLRQAGHLSNEINSRQPYQAPNPYKLRNILWALTRIDDPAARAAVRGALAKEDESVRRVALQSISLWRDKEDAIHLGEFLKQKSPAQTQRIAAEAIGRVDASNLIPLLLSEGANHLQTGDRVLEHSLAYALIELDAPEATTKWANYSSGTPASIVRVALIALDQMDNGGLKPELVTPCLLSTNAELKKTASWIISRHPEWGDALTGFFRDALAKKEISQTDQNELQKQLAELSSNAKIQELITATLKSDSKQKQLLALRAIHWADLKAAPPEWGDLVAQLLSTKDPQLLQQAVTTARNLSFEKKSKALIDALLAMAKDKGAAPENRLNALSAVRGQLTLDAELFDFVKGNLASSQPVLIRGAASSILTRAKLTDEQLVSLTDSLKSSGPLEVSKLLSVFEHSTNEALGLKIVAELKEAKALKSLRGESLKQHLGKYPSSVQQQLDQLVATLNIDAGKQSAHINELLASLQNGDIRRGQKIFKSTKAACSSCHRIGYGGGQVGPDLTKIGQVRTERDLLEAIVYPSASFVRSFEPMIVTTKNEEEYSGILKKDAADEVVLVTGPNAESRIARSDIAEMRPGTVSVMPQGLDEQLTKQELADLIAFLKATKW